MAIGDSLSLCSYRELPQQRARTPLRSQTRPAHGNCFPPTAAGFGKSEIQHGKTLTPPSPDTFGPQTPLHPELKPWRSWTENHPEKTPAEPRSRRVRGQPRAENPTLVSFAAPRRGEGASSSSRGNILPRSSARKPERFSQQQRFLNAGCLLERQGRLSRLLSAIHMLYPRQTGSRDVHFWHNTARLTG